MHAAVAHRHVSAAGMRALESARQPVFNMIRAGLHCVQGNMRRRGGKVFAEHAIPGPVTRKRFARQERVGKTIRDSPERNPQMAPTNGAGARVEVGYLVES
jgi:hypothetical protein